MCERPSGSEDAILYWLTEYEVLVNDEGDGSNKSNFGQKGKKLTMMPGRTTWLLYLGLEISWLKHLASQLVSIS